jgi:eukaryotic-like serine/threonine-protein kinase
MSRIRRLIVEIHRRSLWQVVGIFFFGSWAAYQVIAEVTDRMGLPDWVPGFAIVLFLIGLPIVVATAFVEEGLPGQAQRRSSRRRRGGRNAGNGGHAAPPARAAQEEVPSLLTWRRSILAGIGAFLLLGVATGSYMGMREAGIGPFGSLVGAGVLDARDRLIVADFDSRTPDPELGAIVAEAFRVDFSQSPILTLVDASWVREALRRMDREPHARLDAELTHELSLREGLKAYVAGEVAAAGGGYLLSARLVSAADGTVLASFRETAAGEGLLLPAIDRLSKRLRERIGESLRTIRANPPLEQVTTPSLEALRRYSQAEAAMAQERDYDRALALLEEAVALDPGFAMAWRKIGVVLSNQNREAPRIIEAMTRAYEHRERLTERERFITIGSYHDIAMNDVPAAIQAYRTVLETHPADPVALNNLGRLYGFMGDRESETQYYERVIAAEPYNAVTYNNLVFSYYAMGRTDDARRIHALMAERFPGNPDVQNQAALLAYADGDLARTEALIRERRAAFRGSPAVQIETSFQLGNITLVQGRVAAAEANYREALAIQESRGSDVRLGWEINAARGALEQGAAPAAALRVLDELVARDALARLEPAARPYLPLARVYAEAGRVDRARQILAEWQREVPAELRRGGEPLLRAVHGAIAMSEARHEEAVREFHAWRREAAGCVPCGLPEIALAYDLMGQPDSAIAYFERFIEAPFLGRIGADSRELPRALFRLGELYELKGDVARASERTARFLDLWKDADAPLQPRVEEARQRLRRLAGERGG